MLLRTFPLLGNPRIAACFVAFVIAPLAFALVSLAHASAPLELQLERLLVVREQRDGVWTERLEPVLELEPGQLIEERLVVVNHGDEALAGVALTLPLPAGTAYRAGSASRPELPGALVAPHFSHDGGQTFAPPPLTKTVRVMEDGREVERRVEVDPAEYTHVRWSLPRLEPGRSLTVLLRAVVR